MIKELVSTNSILQHYLAEIRDIETQLDPMRFRKNIERLTQFMAYEISKTFLFVDKSVTTPLGEAKAKRIKDHLVVGSILRAGLSMHNGLLEVFDAAENIFLAAFREKTDDHSIRINLSYMAGPSITGKTVILADPMLATGQSMILSIQKILENGKPNRLIIASILATPSAISLLEKEVKLPFEIWTIAIDPELNEKSYIIPGLGDAGDLAFGPKR